MNQEFPKCPICNQKLYRIYGAYNSSFVCKNWKCILYWKCNKGWSYQNSEYYSDNEWKVNGFWRNSKRLSFAKEWAELRSKVLRRDDYTCQICKEYNLSKMWKDSEKSKLVVHHIIPVQDNSALFLDEDNCIVLCEECHKTIHSKKQ